jgi:SAM-dependent methyltransferase
MSVHPDVAGFGTSADAYERGRPDYPSAGVDWIFEQAGLGPGSVVVDLAAGTGKLTRALIGRGARVTAVEPVPEMRMQLRAALPGVEATDGTADDMGLPGNWADCVTVAQAFHWFATDKALAEIARVLRPHGHLALIWNQRDLEQHLQAELSRIVGPYRQDTPSHASGEWRPVIDASTLFDAPLEFHVPHVQVASRSMLVDRAASTSFIARLPAEERAALLAEVAALVAGAAGEDATVELAYITDVYVVARR